MTAPRSAVTALPSGTVIDRLERWATERPDDRAYTFLADGENETDALTWGELHSRVHKVAASLAAVAEPGARAVLLCPPGLDFVTALAGCMAARVIPVPAYPPESARRVHSVRRLEALVRDACPALAIGT